MNKTETSEKQLNETEISSPPDGPQYNDHKYAHQTQERINIVRTLRVRQKIQYQREVITKLSTKESVNHTGQYLCDVRKTFQTKMVS